MQHYALGYRGWKPAAIQQISAELGAIVVDVRFSPSSRAPQWRQGYLQKLLGDRYVHAPELGNRNYRGSTIEIADLPAGLARIEALGQPVILMCACPDPAICHRTVIAEALRQRGHQVKELCPPASAPASPPILQMLLLLILWR